MQRHASLANFVLSYSQLGPSATFAHSDLGQLVIKVIESHDAVTALVGAIEAAPARPPQPALDRYLLPAMRKFAGDNNVKILDDIKKLNNIKILAGRMIRHMVEHWGGKHERKGVPITVASIFANGSIYTLPNTKRGRFNEADRLAWAQRHVPLASQAI